MKRGRIDSGAPKVPKQSRQLDQSYSDNEAPGRKNLPPKSGSSYKKRGKAANVKSNSNMITVQNMDMTTQEIQQAQDLLLHD